ncbi:MAG: phosphoethanolamine transferase [Candidatus Symbiothrix sp.]|jgi:glucan phosphoethanolaminetransferase (alkaline phosphatase superfamily)|nr:phosphoethanolamine transferase [Candidatus Symbiothrix sp.]
MKETTFRIRLWTAFLSLIVLLPNICLVFYGTDSIGCSFSKIIFYLGFSILLYLLPALFLKTRIFFLLQGIFVLAAPFEIAHIYLNRMPATSAFLLSIVDTNWEESTELLTSIRLPIICLVFLWILYFFAVFKKIRNTYFIREKKIRIASSVFFVLAILASFATGYNKKVYPYDIVLRSCQVFETKWKMDAGMKKIRDFKFGAQKIDSLAEKEIYVFVIGETGRYSSYSLNGYGRKTSPLLSKTENLVSYSDFFSEANITTSSLSLLLTRASAEDYERSYVEKSFVDAFQEAGFKTYWISNQGANNKFIARISKDADGEYFNTTSFKETDNFDEQLWVFLDQVLAKNENKILIVLHTLGSHFRYNFRYPNKYELFKPSLKGSFDYALISAKNKRQFINTYDNSILYTDFFLSKTIRKIDSLKSVSALVYVADHGENLFDTKENIVFHGGSKYTEYDFHVPFFVWTSDKYNLQYPEKVENLRCNKDKKLCTENVFYSLLDMAHITFPEHIREKSIVSEFLQEDSLRYIVNTNMETEVLRMK